MGIKTFLKKNKEGAILGAFLGAAGYYAYNHFYNINPLRAIMMDSSGLIDKAMDYMPIENLATLKVMLLFIIGGMLTGIIIDSVWHPRK